MIWLSADEVIALGVPGRTIRDWSHKETITTRPGAKAANGRHRKEILFDSLPPKIQARYLSGQEPRMEFELGPAQVVALAHWASRDRAQYP